MEVQSGTGLLKVQPFQWKSNLTKWGMGKGQMEKGQKGPPLPLPFSEIQPPPEKITTQNESHRGETRFSWWGEGH